MNSKRLIKLPEVSNRTSLSKTSIYALIKIGKFPPQIKLGKTSVWLESAIEKWMDDQIAASQEGGARS